MKPVFFIYKVSRRLFNHILIPIQKGITLWKFWGNNVTFSHFKTNGIPYVMVAKGGKLTIGKNLSMNNGIRSNPIGCTQPCTFFVHTGCSIEIGENVGISQSALISHCSIKIGNNVKIGGGSYIYTSDFHSLDANIRSSKDDLIHRVSKPVIICNNAFIGAHSTILKGVTIGENSIIGAGSVVTKDIPANQIWAGNPAKFIRNI